MSITGVFVALVFVICGMVLSACQPPTPKVAMRVVPGSAQTSHFSVRDQSGEADQVQSLSHPEALTASHG